MSAAITGIRVVTSGDLRGEWDGDRIAQVVSNLVRNAIDHGSPHEPITVTLQGRDDDVLIEAHNFGPTIPSTALGSLFEPAGRHEASAKHRGLGLGLYIARYIVGAHEGDIRAQSSDEAGTRFVVRLPRRAREGAQPRAPSRDAQVARPH